MCTIGFNCNFITIKFGHQCTAFAVCCRCCLVVTAGLLCDASCNAVFRIRLLKPAMRAGSTRCFGAAAASGRNSMLHGQIQLDFLHWHGLLISSAGNYRLAGMYSNGFGVEAPDQERAFTLFRMAATQGNRVSPIHGRHNLRKRHWNCSRLV